MSRQEMCSLLREPAPGSALPSAPQTFRPPPATGRQRGDICPRQQEGTFSKQQLGGPAPFPAPTQRLGMLRPRQGGIQGPEAPLGLAGHEVQEEGGSIRS